jgi:hypothetical protein
MGKLKRGKEAKQAKEDIMAWGDLVISNVIAYLDLDLEDQDFVNSEVRWLFGAADNLLKICRDEIDRNQPIAVPIPPEAQRLPEANNQLLNKPRDPAFEDIKDWHGKIETRWQENVKKEIESYLRLIDSYLRRLGLFLEREATLGEASKSNVSLQVEIRHNRIEIIRILQNMAKFMNDAYGILVTSPDQLAEFLT